MAFLPYSSHIIDDSDRKAVLEALSSPTITRGPQVRAFEEELASYVGAPYVVAFSSASAALEAAYLAAGLSQSDTVISTPNTFVATVAPAKRIGASIQLADIDQKGNIDCQQALSLLHAPRTRGRPFFVPVHFAGFPIDMRSLTESVYAQDLVIIEDAAHALGSLYPDGTKVGSCAYSDMTVFSFHPAKNITTGEGGAVSCVSKTIYEALRRFRDSGIEREQVRHASSACDYYEVPVVSSNYHMTEMQAALGRSQLARIDTFHERKKELQKRYLELLSTFPALRPLLPEETPSCHLHLFVVSIAFEAFGKKRSEVIEELKKQGIGTQYHYVPLYHHDGLGMDLEVYKESCPMMEEHFKTALSLPYFSSMKVSDVEHVVQTLKTILFCKKG